MIGDILKGIFAGIASFWNATIHIVWGFATIFILMSLINYYQIDTTLITGLLDITGFLARNWEWFFIVFLGYELNRRLNIW